LLFTGYRDTADIAVSGAEEKIAWIGGEAGPRNPGGADREAGGIASTKGWTASGIATAAVSRIASTGRERSPSLGSVIAWIGWSNAWRGSKIARRDSSEIGEGLRGTGELGGSFAAGLARLSSVLT
jgi:hypothetical protein